MEHPREGGRPTKSVWCNRKLFVSHLLALPRIPTPQAMVSQQPEYKKEKKKNKKALYRLCGVTISWVEIVGIIVGDDSTSLITDFFGTGFSLHLLKPLRVCVVTSG